jgi:hypothetical protein
MKMNVIISRYKKTALLATFVAAIGMSSILSAACGACAAAAAIRQSIKDAQAAKIAAEGKKALESELDEIDPKDMNDGDRAPREALVDPCVSCPSCQGNPCSLDAKLQLLFNCCVNTNEQVRHQGHEAKKCCKRLNHEIDEIEDQVEDGFSIVESLIISQGVAAAACCSVTESLIISDIDAAAACCSATSAQINALNISVADQISVLNLSIAEVFALLTLVFDCTCT